MRSSHLLPGGVCGPTSRPSPAVLAEPRRALMYCRANASGYTATSWARCESKKRLKQAQRSQVRTQRRGQLTQTRG
jgi:hypothetical protein